MNSLQSCADLFNPSATSNWETVATRRDGHDAHDEPPPDDGYAAYVQSLADRAKTRGRLSLFLVKSRSGLNVVVQYRDSREVGWYAFETPAAAADFAAKRNEFEKWRNRACPAYLPTNANA